VATLGTLADAGRLPRVEKVVVFACSNPSDVERSERPATEHALFLGLRDFFIRQQLQPPSTVFIVDVSTISALSNASVSSIIVQRILL
jgi:hypothetical protein